jgi:CheY-like chemotaxis protein
LYSALRYIHLAPTPAPANTENVAPTSISESAHPQTTKIAPPPTGQVILLAEDNIFNQQAFTDLLTAKGYVVVLAVNGADALERAEECNPALILMDIQMPVMDGLEATRRLREHPQFAQIPIIALTALAMPGDRERCLAAGANDYLTKPVSLKKLLSLIQTFLTHSDTLTVG